MNFPAIKQDAIDHPWPEPPAPDEMIEVAPGLHWIRFPMPISLDHINLWLLEDGETWTLIDTGFGTDETCGLWRTLLAGAASDRKLGRLICTHHHPDHFGQAGWLARTYGIEVSMTEKEWLLGALLTRMSDEAYAAGQDRFFAEHGVPADVRTRLHAVGNEYRNRMEAPPNAFRRLRDGQTLRIGGRDWQVLALEGHSEELAGLYCAELRVLIPGDQILPKITPNISVHWFKDGTEPLAEYLASLDRLGDMLPADTLVLPSHKLPFTGVQTRIGELQAHHRDRLDSLEEAMSDGEARDAYALMPAIFPRAIGDEHVMFALGESVAHLVHLVSQGRAERIDRDGRALYRRV